MWNRWNRLCRVHRNWSILYIMVIPVNMRLLRVCLGACSGITCRERALRSWSSRPGAWLFRCLASCGCNNCTHNTHEDDRPNPGMRKNEIEASADNYQNQGPPKTCFHVSMEKCFFRKNTIVSGVRQEEPQESIEQDSASPGDAESQEQNSYNNRIPA
ncbi:hypothetical protein SCIP_1306 [Scardovia inopinata JCM 12537]|nr:hypothetical protein SCIP_1306 [Scardovia inopinata JCM 12537]